jgi:hypothetical protein
MYINNISVNSRHNSPTVLSRTALLTYFYNNGRYADPYEISAVSIFRAADNFYPSSVVGPDGQILQTASGLVLMNYSNSAARTDDTSFDSSNYSTAASGIFRIIEGVYAVVLDRELPSTVFNLSGNEPINNRVSSTGDYIDVWTVRRVVGSNLDTTTNEFTLSEDRFYNTTEKILFRVSTRMSNRHLTLGSKVDLKFTNEFNIENRNIDKSITNLFKNSLILDPQIEIVKENSERNIPSRVVVSSFQDTSGLCDVTSDNTVIFNWDTEALRTHPELLAGNLGSITGIYNVRIKFKVLDEVFLSNVFSFTVS